MEETRRIKAIVLDRKPIREHDLLVTVYSQERGKEQLIARGARKFRSKIAAHVEPLSFIDGLVIVGKSKNYLGSALSAYVFPKIKADLERLSAVGRAVKFFRDNTREMVADQDIYKDLVDYLVVSDSVEADFELISDVFIYRIIVHFGFALSTTGCSVCKKPLVGSNKFDILTSSMRHAHCSDQVNALTISEKCAMFIAEINKCSFDKMAKFSQKRGLSEEERLLFHKVIENLQKNF